MLLSRQKRTARRVVQPLRLAQGSDGILQAAAGDRPDQARREFAVLPLRLSPRRPGLRQHSRCSCRRHARRCQLRCDLSFGSVRSSVIRHRAGLGGPRSLRRPRPGLRGGPRPRLLLCRLSASDGSLRRRKGGGVRHSEVALQERQQRGLRVSVIAGVFTRSLRSPGIAAGNTAGGPSASVSSTISTSVGTNASTRLQRCQ